MPSAKQLTLPLGRANDPRREHGAGIREGKRKLARPFDRHRPVHVTMRALNGHGAHSMLLPERAALVRSAIERQARRHGVRIHEFANSGNHLHFVLKARSRVGFQNFLRTTASAIAIQMTGAKKGQAMGAFWAGLAYSKVLEWGRMVDRAVAYVLGNAAEAAGLARGVNGRQISAGQIVLGRPG